MLTLDAVFPVARTFFWALRGLWIFTVTSCLEGRSSPLSSYNNSDSITKNAYNSSACSIPSINPADRVDHRDSSYLERKIGRLSFVNVTSLGILLPLAQIDWLLDRLPDSDIA